MIATRTISAGNPRQNGRETKKKPISATISSQEELPFQKMESRPKMMRERNWMICLRISRIKVISQVTCPARETTCDTGVRKISFVGPSYASGGNVSRRSDTLPDLCSTENNEMICSKIEHRYQS